MSDYGFNCLDTRIRHVPQNYQLSFVIEQYLAQKDLSNNLFFDTCAHDVHFLECAFKQRGVPSMVLGTEAPGSGRAPRPEGPGITGDDLVPVIGSFSFLSDADKRDVFRHNPAKLFPRMAELG